MRYLRHQPVIALFFCILIFNINSLAQDSLQKKKEETVPDAVFKRILNQQFTNLVTGQSKTSIGNFAAIDLKDAEVSFAGSCIIKGGRKSETKHNSVLTMKASGGISDGLFAVFDNSRLNTNVTLDLQYNFLNPTANSLSYISVSEDSILDKERAILEEYEIKSLAVKMGQPRKLLELELLRLNVQMDTLEAQWKREDNVTKRDSLSYEMAKTNILIKRVAVQIEKLPTSSIQQEEVNNWKSAQLKNLRNTAELKIASFELRWFSIGYKVHNNSFKFFNSSLPSAQQVADTDFVSHEARFQYSHYNWTRDPFKTYFFDMGVAFNYDDNFSSLDKLELSETTEYGSAPGVRTTVKKYNVYKGDYKRNLKSVRLYSDYYRFLFSDNIAALHGNIEFKAKDTETPKWNALVGFFVSFKNSKEENAVVNAELYYSFLDIFKTGDTELKFFERNTAGIRFVFPITFKN